MMIEKLFYQIHIVVPFFFPTLAMLCIKLVCKELPVRAVSISVFGSLISLTVYYFLHITLSGGLPYVYSSTKIDGQTGLGDGLIMMMSLIAYPLAVFVAGFTFYPSSRKPNESKMG
jgi:hypothetical protein